MKPLLIKSVFFIFFGVFILCSCHKENIVKPGSSNQAPPPPPPPPPPAPVGPTDTTGGVILQNIVWEIDSLDMGPTMKSVIALVYQTETLPISVMLSRSVQVFIQVGSSSNWIYVPFDDWYGNNNPLPANNGYIWDFPHYPYGDCGFFEIENYPANFKLAGKTVKVKVKI